MRALVVVVVLVVIAVAALALVTIRGLRWKDRWKDLRAFARARDGRVHLVVSVCSARWALETLGEMRWVHSGYVPEDLLAALRMGIDAAEDEAFREHVQSLLDAAGPDLQAALERGDVAAAREIWRTLDVMFRG